MHIVSASSADCRPSEPHPTFPCRPCPTVRKRSPGLRWKSRTRAPAHLVVRRQTPRRSAPFIVVIAHITLLIVVSTLFESSVRAQMAARARSIARFADSIAEASARFAVPARWIRAIIQIESAGDEHTISPRGAMGLMQLMPSTWVELSARYGLGLDPFDARDNIMAGTAYLEEMHDRLGSAGFLAAYHAGPWRYEQHLVTGKPLPSETTAYVAAVTPLLDNEHGEYAAVDGRRALPWREAPLFVERANPP